VCEIVGFGRRQLCPQIEGSWPLSLSSETSQNLEEDYRYVAAPKVVVQFIELSLCYLRTVDEEKQRQPGEGS